MGIWECQYQWESGLGGNSVRNRSNGPRTQPQRCNRKMGPGAAAQQQ